ncbi:MAG: hypothetical protein ACR2ME_00365 [Acidimicrobiia bacterium]
MRWFAAGLMALVLVIAIRGAGVKSLTEPDDFEFVSESANIGVGRAPSLPINQPISATLVFTGGSGRLEDPYRFCLSSDARTGAVTCLFDVLLLGPPSAIKFGAWYQVTASFERLPGGAHSPLGDLIAIGDAHLLRVAGWREERGPRLQEESELLSNWSAEHKLSGYLRIDAAYIWYLTEEARADAVSKGIVVRAVWADAR